MLNEDKPAKLLNLLKEQVRTIFSLTNDLTNSEFDTLCQNEIYFQKNMLSELKELKVITMDLMSVVSNK